MADQTKTHTAPNRTSKRDILIRLLKRKNGASIDEVSKANGWLPHSSRAALTGLRKAGFEIDSEKSDKVRRYRIVKAPAK